MASFTPAKLHGGRTVADLPQEFIDARPEREVPEHQEFYYHPDNGTSMIIEIEARFQEEDSVATGSSSAQSTDLQAVDYHLNSLAEGEGPCTIINPAHRVQMGKLDAPAYRLHARIELTNDSDAEDNREERAVTSCHMLLIRLEKQGADVIVWVNVSGVEVGNSSVTEVVDERDDIASSIIDRLIQSFDLGELDEWKIEVVE